MSSPNRASKGDSTVGPRQDVVVEEGWSDPPCLEPAVSEEEGHGEQQLALLRTIAARLLSSPSAEESALKVSILGHLIPGAERCVIFLFDAIKRRLRPEAVVNLPQELIPFLAYNEERTRLLTTAAEQAKPSLVIYLPGNKQFSSLWRLAHREDIKTLWLIPWRDQDDSLLGAILFVSGEAFSPSQQALASVMLLTDWLSMALQDARARQDSEKLRGHRIITMSDSSHQERSQQIEPNIISVLSHELLSPLTLIKGYAATLLQLGEAITEEQSRQYLQGIESATNKLTQLLESFRDISRLEAVTPNLTGQPTFLPDLLRKTISEIQSQTTKHVIKLHLSRPLPPVDIDRQKIEQLMTNLLVNAVKYSPQGGDIEVAVRQVRAKERLREILGEVPPLKLPCLMVTVTDLGVGIPEEELERVFERFYRVNNRLTRATSGAGLGLYICKIIVEAHGGHIWAKSRVGEGSTFSFSLPVD